MLAGRVGSAVGGALSGLQWSGRGIWRAWVGEAGGSYEAGGKEVATHESMQHWA